MIREYPQVPAAVELADTARYIYNHEFVLRDPAFDKGWVWQSPPDFDPALRIVVPADSSIRKVTGFIFTHAAFVQVHGLTEYEVNIPIRTAERIDDDAFIEDFVAAYRQYRKGRSPLEIDFDQFNAFGANN